MRNLVAILIFLCTLPHAVHAADFGADAGARNGNAAPECVFEHYTSLDGLPHNSISDIYKDSKGFVWLCTWYGLSRFDGYTFKNYRTLPGDRSPLSHNRFRTVTEDSAGYMWVVTYDNHLYRFNRHLEIFEEIPGLPDEGSDYKVGRVMCSSVGNTWIAIEGKGLVYTLPPQMHLAPETVSFIGNPQVGRRITGIVEGRGGRIFVVSELGLTLLTPEGNGFRASVLNNRRDNPQLCKNGKHLFYGAGSHVTIFDDEARTAGEIPLPAGVHVTALEFSDADNTLYIGTREKGVYRYPVQDGKLTADTASPGRIRYLKADSRGTLWVTTEHEGITRWDPAKGSYKHFAQKMNAVSYYIDTLTRVVEAGERVWIKMNKVGFGYYDRASDNVLPFYNTAGERFTNGVPCFAIDSTNVLWMSTSQRALEKITIIDQKATVFDPAGGSAERSASEIRAITIDSRGRLWMGNKNGELFCYDRSKGVAKHWPDHASGHIGNPYAIKEDRDGNIWVGTKGDGVLRLAPDGNGWSLRRFRHNPADPYSLSHDDIYAIEQDADGRMWFGSYGGAINMLETPDADRFVTTANSFPRYPAPMGNRVRWMHMLPDGTMAVATVEGMLLFDPAADPANADFRVVQKIPGDVASLGNNDVIHIMTDSRDRVWISTFGGGLNLLEGYREDGSPRFRIYSENEGLSSNIVLAATEGPDGSIWASTENGIARLNVDEGVFGNYSRYDGIPTTTFSEATAITTADGKVLFGSTNNLIVVDPEAIKPLPEPSGLVFTGLQVDNSEVKAGKGSPLQSSVVEADSFTLPHNYSAFRIEFAALNYRMQPKMSYMYRLEGFEKEWTRVKDTRSAAYTNVPYGNYRFVVRSVTGDGFTQGDEINIGVRIQTPPWRSWWAYLLYVAVAAVLMVVIYRVMRTRRNLQNEVQVERRMTDLKLRFFTNISHELRTPLTLILGSVEDVGKREALSARGENNISLAQKNAKRMLSLINQLLDFRKIVNEKMEIKVRHIDMIALARGVLEDFRELANERRIELMFNVSSETLLVWADPQRMESVIYNLLSNAFKYTPDGKRIELTVSHKEGDPNYSISVSDSGHGIAKDKQEVIFDRFVQVGRPVEGQTRGTGIGLALCKEIAELHHGHIAVESQPGEGATFTVTLPGSNAAFSMDQIEFEPGESLAAQPEKLPGSAIESQRVVRKAPAGAPKILLVEDNHELRVFIYNNLIEYYDVAEAVNGEEALEKIAQTPPDIVVTDLMMPRMDGIELTNRIRSNFETSHIPIIMLTARNETDTRTEAMRYGADGYITKPFSMELLLARIDNLLTQRRNLFEKFSAKGAKEGRGFEVVPDEIVVTDRDEEFLKGIMTWIDENIDDTDLTIDRMASHIGIGRTTMYNKIKGLTGKSPVEIIKEYRVTKAMMLLRSGQFSVSEAAYKVGFSDPGYFSKCFKEQYKMSPAEFLKNQKK